MLWLDLRAEPMVISVPAVEKERYYSVQLIDGNTYNFGYIGSRATGDDAGDYLVAGPDWKGEMPAGIRKVFHPRRLSRCFYFARNSLTRGHAKRDEDAGRIQGAAAIGVSQPASAARPAEDRLSSRDDGRNQRRISSSISAPHFSSCHRRRKTTEIRARLASIGIGPGKTFEFKDLDLEHKARSGAGHEGR